MKELTHAKLIAIASLDKKVTVWDFFTRTYINNRFNRGGSTSYSIFT